MGKASDRQQSILKFIREESLKQGFTPTVREIAAALSIKSTSTVHKDISILIEQGFLKKDPAKSRSLVLIDKTPQNKVQQQPEKFVSNFTEFTSEIVELPVIGDIAAGTPILADESISDVFPVPARYLGRGTNFMLKVRGDSMMEVGIYDGDLIMVEKTPVAYNGDIVVAMVHTFESEATVKTYYRESDGRIRLQPENSSMNPMYFDNVDIVGKVRGVFRFF